MPDPAILVIISGAVAGLGAFLVLAGWARRPVRMGDAFAALDGTVAGRQGPEEDLVRDADSSLERLGAYAYARLHLPLGRRARGMLQLSDRSIGDFMAEKIVLCLAGLALPTIVTAVSAAMGSPLRAPTLLVALALGALGWCWPDLSLRAGSKRIRFEADEALLTLFDLVMLERMANRSATQALSAAASVSDVAIFRRVRGVLAQAGLEQRPPWDGLRRLAHDLRLPPLKDLADIMQLDEQGASLTEALAARVEELRDAHLSAGRMEAQEVSERMTLWMALPVMVFGLSFIAPPLMRLAGVA
ncbi:hypothetical protein [Propionibacterium freudenreichii]|uniref:hypothetical protein n=1 Tax=Propionibacterium freudenreichii TaxID=1744 RepID=UPI0011083CD5|nr:hypothetical protein [Propionibacterium freudenreichii]MDK9351349.1 hypothetical protein [Propionibacterium freudenreichii]